MAQSVVDDQGVYKSTCGYCHSGSRTSISHGMYARQMSVDDYQDLINRGWRRSGNFLYKPAMDRTCCPPYTIRLDVNDFAINKEQRAVLRRLERFLSGNLEIAEAPRERTGGESTGDRPAQRSGGEGLQAGGGRRGKRDLENPGSLGRESAAKLAESSPANGLRLSSSHHLESGSRGLVGILDTEERRSGVPVLQAVETAPSNPAATEAGGSQTNSLGKSVSTSPAEHLRTQIEEFVAQLLGRPCPVIATVREVAQKVRRKLDTRKQEGGDKAAEELMYSCNIAFVLAAHVAKVGVSKQGAAGAQREESAERDLPTNGWAGSSDTESGERDRPSLAASSPEAIAEAVAAGLRTGGSAGADWRAEACRGHLNFYAPAERLRGEEAGAADETRSAGQTTANPASMSGRKHPGEQGRPGSEAEGQPKRRKRFEMRMSRAKFDKEEYLLYRKYQVRVHNDAPHEVSESSYRRFLVDSPLVAPPHAAASRADGDTAFSGFGSFHQQYRVDGRLVAVGVVDVLPQCLSSVYLFWDPDLAPLSLGKLSALKEIEWVRAAQRACPSLHYYYLGFYIHNCAKMRYKAAYSPSQLLCPLHYTWHPHSAAKELLDRQAYSDLCQTGGQAHHRLRGAATPQGTGTGKNSVESQSRGTAPTASLESSSSAQAAVTPTGTGRSEAEPELLHTTETSGEGPGVQPRLGAEIQPESREERHLGDGQGVHDSEDFGGDWLAKDESEGEDAQGDSSEQDRGMTDGDTDEGLSLDLSDESGSEPDDGGESGGGAGPGAATLEELGGVPLLLGGTVIPFRFFQQLGMLPPSAVQLLLARLQPYRAAVGPMLANRLVYTLG